MEINTSKSKYLSAKSGQKDDPNKHIIPLEGVQLMKYLGSEVNHDPAAHYLGKFSERAASKSQIYKKSIMRLSQTSSNPAMFAERLWESTALPSILYSSESLLVRSNELNQCEQSQDSLSKFILQVQLIMLRFHFDNVITLSLGNILAFLFSFLTQYSIHST